MIDRPQYLRALRRWKDKQMIKVITGIRRCGKSTLMELFQAELRLDGVPDAQIIAVNLEDFANIELRDPMKLHAYILSRAGNERAYVFLDEIQNVRDFPPMIDSLFLRKNLDLYLTGSNAYMLSGELATHLSGRYVTIDMLPLSFSEYAAFTGSRDSLSATYRRYLETSFPYATELGGDRKAIEEYLSGIYHTVVLKDVVGRLKNADPMMLESVLRFVYSSTGSPISTKKISDTMAPTGGSSTCARLKNICRRLWTATSSIRRGAMTSAASSISRRLKSIMPWISACGIICLAGAMRIPATSSKT